MVASRILRVSPHSELSHLLHDALQSGEPVVINTGEAMYRLGVESTESLALTARRPSPAEVERSRAGIREGAGSWPDVDADAFKDYIRERRRTANRSSVEL